MYYDKEKEEAVDLLVTVAEAHGDTNVFLLEGITSALYNIANELHEINLSLRAGENNAEN